MYVFLYGCVYSPLFLSLYILNLYPNWGDVKCPLLRERAAFSLGGVTKVLLQTAAPLKVPSGKTETDRDDRPCFVWLFANLLVLFCTLGKWHRCLGFDWSCDR